MLYKKYLLAPGIEWAAEMKGAKHVYHLYAIRIKERDKVKKALDAAKVSNMIYYPVPLHLQAAYKSLNMKPGSLPVTERAADEVLSLPMYPELNEELIRSVADAVKKAMA